MRSPALEGAPWAMLISACRLMPFQEEEEEEPVQEPDAEGSEDGDDADMDEAAGAGYAAADNGAAPHPHVALLCARHRLVHGDECGSCYR